MHAARLALGAIIAQVILIGMPAVAFAQGTQQVDPHEDSRVGVQLVVLGLALIVVVVIGTAAYLIRRRLGLVAPPPEPDAGGHH